MPRGVPNRKPLPIDDERDDDPIRQSIVPANVHKKGITSSGAPSVFAFGAANKPPRAKRVLLDAAAVEIQRGVPLPPRSTVPGGMSTHATLWERMQPGDMVELSKTHASGLAKHALKASGPGSYALRRMAEDRQGVWRLK